MRTIFLGLLAVCDHHRHARCSASAEVTVDTPVGGVRVGPDRGYDRYHDRNYHRVMAVTLAIPAQSLSARTMDLCVAFDAAIK